MTPADKLFCDHVFSVELSKNNLDMDVDHINMKFVTFLLKSNKKIPSLVLV